MRQRPGNADVRAFCHGVEHGGKFFFRAHADAIHAGVDLDLCRCARALFRRNAFQREEHLGQEHHRGHIVFHCRFRRMNVGRAEHQDGRGHARLTQLRALFDQRHRQHIRPGLQRGLRNLHRAVAIGIRLDHRQHLCRAAASATSRTL